MQASINGERYYRSNKIPQAINQIDSRVKQYKKVGTLCDHPAGLTCSWDTLDRWGEAGEIIGYASFEEAAEDTLLGIISAFWVPSAYPDVRKFILSPEFKIATIETLEIPPLVLAGKPFEQPASSEIIFYHPATSILLSEIDNTYNDSETVSSNSVASKKVLEYGDKSICITNSLCSTYFNLQVYKTLREGVQMPFYLFKKS